jgi:hypothetical protein
MKIKSFIEIPKSGFKEDYVFCREHLSIYKKGYENKYCLFDLYGLFNNDENKTMFTLENRLNICQQMLYAYELGIQDTKKEISNKFNQFIGFESE